MTAAALSFTGPRTVEIVEEPIPEPAANEVLVEARYSAISSGTELLLYRDQAPADLPADLTIDAIDGTLAYPVRYGYATAGSVTAIGTEVDREWLGRSVFVFHPHASHFTARPSTLHPVPEGVPLETATLLPTLETAVNFLLDGAPVVGERVAVFGQGPVGLLTTALLADHPLATLLVVDPIERRRRLGLEYGADEAVTPDALVGDGDGMDCCFEVSGNPRALDQAIGLTGYGGRIIVGSWYGDQAATLGLGGRFHRSRITVKSSQVSTIDPSHRGRWDTDRRLSVAWEHLDRIDLDSIVTHRIPIAEAPRAYALLDDRPEDAIQVLLEY